MRILLVEDDKPLANFIEKGLIEECYSVEVTNDGLAALDTLSVAEFDLLVLDLNLPKMDGLSLLSQMRPKKPEMAILVLTARTAVEDRVKSLDLGADDYLTKPFSFAEMAARIRALLRRGKPVASSVLVVGDLQLDRIERRVQRAGNRIEVTAKEFNLLEYLMRNAGKRVTRTMIMQHVWDISYDTSTNVVDVYINYLRRKVDEGYDTRLIHTIRGVGYELAATGTDL